MDAPLWTWRRLVAVTLAKSLLVGLIGLAAWGALPALIGWHPTTVSSGSMMPRLHVGDIAVSRPLGAHVPPLTSVLLFDDPDHPGRLRMHRFVRLDPDGLLVTRGDANNADDSTHVALSAVRGIGTLRVPWIALPIVWLREGQWLFLGLVAAGLALVLGVAVSGGSRTFAEEDEPADPEDPEDPASGEPAAGPADPAAPVPAGDDAWRRPALRRAGALLGTALLTLAVATPADAAFRATTTTQGSMAAATYFGCAGFISTLSPVLWYRMDETSSTTTTATDSSGNARTGVYGSGGKTTTTAKACIHDTGRAMTFDGSTGYLSSPAVPGGAPNTFTLAVWFRTTTTQGGKLIGFGNAQTGSSPNYDRHLYLGDTGKLYFGVYSNGNKTLASTSSYNDGAWHLAVATMSTAGMRLYADGRLIGTDTTTTTGETATTSYVRVAYDNLTFWQDQPTSFFLAGTLDDAVYFSTALTATQVQTLYSAGTT